MRRVFILLVMIVACAGGVSAQDCGNGLPCGPIPWPLPVMPELVSPTPINRDVDLFPTEESGLVDTPTPSPTWTLIPSATLAPTLTPAWTQEALDGALATAQALGTATPQAVTVDGQEIGMESASSNVGAIGLLFGYLKGIPTSLFGPFSPLIATFFAGFGIKLFIDNFSILTKMVIVGIGLVRKVVQLILEFIPL